MEESTDSYVLARTSVHAILDEYVQLVHLVRGLDEHLPDDKTRIAPRSTPAGPPFPNSGIAPAKLVLRAGFHRSVSVEVGKIGRRRLVDEAAEDHGVPGSEAAEILDFVLKRSFDQGGRPFLDGPPQAVGQGRARLGKATSQRFETDRVLQSRIVGQGGRMPAGVSAAAPEDRTPQTRDPHVGFKTAPKSSGPLADRPL